MEQINVNINNQPIEEVTQPSILESEQGRQENAEDLLTPKFIIKAIIAFIIYASVFFIDFTVEYIWMPIIAMVYAPFSSLFESLSNGDSEILKVYQNMFINNVLYITLFIIIVGMFMPEIIKGFKKFKNNLWQLSLVPLIQLGTLVSSAVVVAIVNLFISLPNTSQNQESINASMAVSPWGNVFPTMIGAPFVEEIVFRLIIGGGIFMLLTTLFNKKNSKAKKIGFSAVAILVSTIFFAWIHVSSGDYLAIVPYLVMGLSMTLTYFLSGRNIMMSISLHMYHNIFAFFINMLI